MNRTILGLILCSLIIACAPPVEQPAAPEEVVPPVYVNEQDDEVAPPAPPAEPEPEPVVERVKNPDTVKLTEKADTVQSMSFLVTELPETTGDQTWYVRGDKAKIELVQPLKMDGWGADFVYLDFTKKTAVAYCERYRSCMDEQLKGNLKYNEWKVKLPTQWVDEVQYGDEITTVQYNNRPVAVIEWQEDGMYYQAYVDNFYGLPQRVAVANDAEITDVVSGYEYQSMAINAVSEEDVTPLY